MINMGELFSNDRIYNIPMELIPLTDTEKENAKVEVNDLLFARQSLIVEGAGKCSIVMETDELTVFEAHIIRVRLNPELAYTPFFYYYFKNKNSPIRAIIQHCVQAGIKASDLAEITVKLPPLPTQQKIAAILSSLDDKIELNNKININLEQQAQALFKHWFVDFEPFGGKMPEGWKVGKLGDFVEIKRGGSPRPIQKFLSDEGYRWLKIPDVTSLSAPFVLNIAEHIKEEGLSKTVFLKAGSLVLSNSATPGIPKKTRFRYMYSRRMVILPKITIIK
jgi:type I restriction enzyme S subunit